jgi:hypothetical protein
MRRLDHHDQSRVLMVRSSLHDPGSDGRCTECGEPFRSPTRLAIFDSVTGANMSDAAALLRAATYLKWWRDGAIAEAEPPDDIGELIITLEQLAAAEPEATDDLELVELPQATRLQDEPPDE